MSDEDHNTFAGQAWTFAFAVRLVGRLRVGATDVAKTLQEKLTARIAKLESACAKDIKKYCKDVTPGEGRVIYCMQAHEDKISPQCTFELEDELTERAELRWTI